MKRERLALLGTFICISCLFSFAIYAQEKGPEPVLDNKARAAKLFEQGYAFSKDKQFDLAIEAYREAIKLDPGSATAYHNLGVAYANTKRRHEALEAFQMAVKLGPGDARFHVSLASSYMGLTRWAESEAAFKEAIRLDPNRGDTYNAYGFLLDNMRRFDEKIVTDKKAIELAPENPANFHNLGLTYMKLGRAADAIEPLERALKMAPTYRSARFHLSNALSALRKYREAVDSYTKLLEVTPNDATILSARAWNYMYLGGSGPEAAADAERYLKLFGWRTTSSPFQVLIAVIGYRSAGMDDKAAAVLAQAQKKADPVSWPFNIIRFYDGQITAEDLLAIAADNDQRTEAYTFVGIDLRLKNKNADARKHFEWVKEYGTRNFNEYPLAVAELERIR